LEWVNSIWQRVNKPLYYLLVGAARSKRIGTNIKGWPAYTVA
jgi:hypothetical protein